MANQNGQNYYKSLKGKLVEYHDFIRENSGFQNLDDFTRDVVITFYANVHSSLSKLYMACDILEKFENEQNIPSGRKGMFNAALYELVNMLETRQNLPDGDVKNKCQEFLDYLKQYKGFSRL